MRFQLVEDVNSNIKRKLIRALGLNPDEQYILHHKHAEKYNPDDSELVAQYKDFENAVLIPMSRAKQPSGNDLHQLIHYLALHKDELDDKFCAGIENNHIKYYSIRDLVDML